MNWDTIQGKWQEYKGLAKQRWGALTDNDLTVIAGKREALAGKLLASFGNSKERVEKEIAEFEKTCASTKLDHDATAKSESATEKSEKPERKPAAGTMGSV